MTAEPEWLIQNLASQMAKKLDAIGIYLSFECRKL